MNFVKIFDQKGMVMPTGRTTRVLVGDNGAVKGRYFCQGYVVIQPNGSIPLHKHEMEETYTVFSGKGVIRVGKEEREINGGNMVLIPPGEDHSLHNTGSEDMHMMFVYAPYQIADHWQEELANK